MRRRPVALACSLLALGTAAGAQQPAAKQLTAEQAARSFGARERVEDISLSPDGKRVAIVSPGPGQASVVQVAEIATGQSKAVNFADGNPFRITGCSWVNDQRIICSFYGVSDAAQHGLLAYQRLTAMDADGSNIVPLGNKSRYSLFQQQSDGRVIDWLDGKSDDVILARTFVPDLTAMNRIGSIYEGLGVDRLNTRTLKASHMEMASTSAIRYLSDGKGTIRMMATDEGQSRNSQTAGVHRYFYRPAGSSDWKPFSSYQAVADEGMYPVAVDTNSDVAYALRKVDGRDVLYRVALDGSMKADQVAANPLVDIDGVITVGRNGRVVGATFAIEKREQVLFDPKFAALVGSLRKALGNRPVSIVGTDAEESTYLVRAGSDVDPGTYYVYDAKTRRLDEIALSRPDLEGVTLGQMRPITYKATDGTPIPGYLTLPPGSPGKKLPAIVMPHGGPAARDEWGFDWLVQFFVNRGYAVLQPNFRGSAGFGDDWLVENGFKSWKTAIGDVNDAARWLVAEGIADPAKLAVVGWSYGGYAALQSGVVDPDLFKAVVAIAPVTDFAMWRDESRGFTNMQIMRDYVGSGPHLTEGSPARNAARIKAPVLMFHGDKDINVSVAQSRLMDQQLRKSGGKSQLVEFKGLDHRLDDSSVREQVLAKSGAFLKAALGL